MTAFAIFNPASDGGRTGRNWSRIEDALGSIFPAMEAAPTRGPGQAAHLARDALRDGRLDIIAIGGDGTINEAMNGFFDRGVPVSREAVFSFVSTGEGRQGGDIARGFGIAPGTAAAVAHLRQSRIHRVDVGKVSCLSTDGVPVTRYFLGEASFGLSGAIATALTRGRVARLMGRRFARHLHTLIQLLSWHECRVRLMAPNVDGHGGFDEIAGIASVVLANGRSFGGGLTVAPEASNHDGLFDLAVMAGGSRRRILKDLASLGAGPAGVSLRRLRTARMTAAPTVDTEGAVLVETDGEGAGVLPAAFEILPGALNVRL
jgi:diacylglycerol kinase family enzyme